MDKRAKDKLVRSLRENGGEQDAQKDLHSRTGRDEKKVKTQEKWKEEVERDLQVLGVRRWRELVARQEKMEGHCFDRPSPQQAVVPMEDEEDITFYKEGVILRRLYSHEVRER